MRTGPVFLDEDARHFYGQTLLACGLARRAVDAQPIQLSQGSGGFGAPPARAILVAAVSAQDEDVTGKVAGTGVICHLLLPSLADHDPVPRRRLHRAMVAHTAAHLRHSPLGQDSSKLKPMGMTVVSALEDARVERLLCRDYPGVRAWFEDFLAPAPDDSDLSFRAFMARLDRILFWPERHDGNHWVNKARELFERAAREHGLEDYAAFRAVASVLGNDLGQMRVRMDPQHYTVPTPYRDDNSYLWRHPDTETAAEDALVLPEDEPPPPPPDSEDAPPQEITPDMELARYHYPEWDHERERLKTDWCTLIDRVPAWQGVGGADQTQLKPPTARKLAPLQLPQARQLDRRNRLRRQWEGEDVDLNAAVEILVDRRLNLRPDPRLFMRPGKGPRPTSLLVLLDVSESVNDAGVEGTPLLDMEKQAALLLAQARVRGVDRLAIHAFSSNTRSEVNYYRLLDFGQPHSSFTTAMIQALQGRYSTRLGAALRHAGNLLQAEPAGQRTLLVITDGEPSDIDVHDRNYLIEDARHAVQYARQTGVRITCLAVDSKADAWVRHIFGWRNFGIAERAAQLPQRLTQMSARLAAGR